MTRQLGTLGLSLGLVLLAFQAITLAAAEPLKQGDRIVFLGDSITQAGAGPGGYVTLVKETLAAEKKDLSIEVIGAGISGNRVPDLEKRLERDVLAKKPTVVVIYIGINDVWHSKNGRGTSKDDYREGLLRIIKAIQDSGARAIVSTASVIGEKHDGSNELDKMLDEYCQISRDVARETKSQLLDLRQAFLNHLKSHNGQNASQGILTTDTVHLNAAGNQFVARQMLAALGVGEMSDKLLRHVVLFKFKDDVTPEQVKELEAAFAALPKKIDVVADFEWGTNNSPEGLADGFTHCFFLTFRDEAGRDAYLPHPAHQEFVSLIKPRLDKVLVVDYWVNR